MNLVPPLRYSPVEDGLFRGAYPLLRNFNFLRRLKLKTIVSLIPEEPTKDLKSFCKAENIEHKWVEADRFKGEPQLLHTDLNMVLAVLLNQEAYPIYLHCLDGRQTTGMCLMALRKVMCWDYQSIYDEFLRFAKEPGNELAFIVDYPADVQAPAKLPRWLWPSMTEGFTPSVGLPTFPKSKGADDKPIKKELPPLLVQVSLPYSPPPLDYLITDQVTRARKHPLLRLGFPTQSKESQQPRPPPQASNPAQVVNGGGAPSAASTPVRVPQSLGAASPALSDTLASPLSGSRGAPSVFNTDQILSVSAVAVGEGLSRGLHFSTGGDLSDGSAQLSNYYIDLRDLKPIELRHSDHGCDPTKTKDRILAAYNSAVDIATRGNPSSDVPWHTTIGNVAQGSQATQPRKSNSTIGARDSTTLMSRRPQSARRQHGSAALGSSSVSTRAYAGAAYDSLESSTLHQTPASTTMPVQRVGGESPMGHGVPASPFQVFEPLRDGSENSIRATSPSSPYSPSSPDGQLEDVAALGGGLQRQASGAAITGARVGSLQNVSVPSAVAPTPQTNKIVHINLEDASTSLKAATFFKAQSSATNKQLPTYGYNTRTSCCDHLETWKRIDCPDSLFYLSLRTTMLFPEALKSAAEHEFERKSGLTFGPETIASVRSQHPELTLGNMKANASATSNVKSGPSTPTSGTRGPVVTSNIFPDASVSSVAQLSVVQQNAIGGAMGASISCCSASSHIGAEDSWCSGHARQAPMFCHFRHTPSAAKYFRGDDSEKQWLRRSASR